MPVKILVVDDEPQVERLLRQRFRKPIRKGKYEFHFAQSGVRALQLLEEKGDFGIALTDINMPEMDGLVFLGHLREKWPEVKAIMVSAYGDMDNIRAAMNRGAFDFITKPIDFEDLERTIDKTIEEVEVARKAARAAELEQTNLQLRELDTVKNTFFTNLSHEFRTPLTVIRGMAERMEEAPDRWLKRGLALIRRNSDNLLDLVNQILDLARLESGNLQLQPVQADILPYLKYLLDTFQSLAEQRQIELSWQADFDRLPMDYDPKRLLWVLSNLLSNALKFSEAGDQVRFEASCPHGPDEQLLLAVEDTGPGIGPEDLPHIFDRFYRASNESPNKQPGTGIGLALTRQLVTQMGGTIEVESEPGAGTRFTVSLPITRKAQPVSEVERPVARLPELERADLADDLPDPEEEQQTILIVEDSPDIAIYLQSCLEDNYQLLFARDGQAGAAKAIEQVPDLIVSDVMMPRKDGFTLCAELKNDIRTSHIPIVLLTARADAESRIQGITRGADAYLAKPFDQRELLARIDQLLDQRRKLQARYRNLDTLLPADDPALRQEDSFLSRVREEVEQRLDDEALSIAGLARSVGISRAQLHNKLKALTGKSPSVFVRTLRLHHARKLLHATDLNISQVAYEVGFRDPAYFSRTFSEEFGHSPREERKES